MANLPVKLTIKEDGHTELIEALLSTHPERWGLPKNSTPRTRILHMLTSDLANREKLYGGQGVNSGGGDDDVIVEEDDGPPQVF